MIKLTLRVPQEIKLKLNAIAALRGKSTSDLTVEVLTEFVNNSEIANLEISAN